MVFSSSKMPFKRNVEIGRVALCNYGTDYGKLVVIVDVIDLNRVLVDREDMVRHVMNLKRLSLTDIVIDITRSPKKTALKSAIEAADVYAKFAASSWGKKLAVQAARKSLSDFDRFKVSVARSTRSAIVKKAIKSTLVLQIWPKSRVHCRGDSKPWEFREY
ncbi:60S ribosomal protein L14, variant 2 [Cymbomonas tetramitiformis]|uniref:60S ribosomal protein L14, variant 2 n=1 Tax=Cymbomonas tetramitiformis TaxID=36881 RepID=A0AAE0GKE9_9CHLO|nr:60S ribosomal protein L14, variant 2 [Cymbomonas tetramitiformis]